MNNAYQYNFNETALKSIQYLNSQAAITNKVDGKYMPAVNEVVTETQKATETNSATHFISIFSAAASKDRMVQTLFITANFLWVILRKKKNAMLNH